MTLSRSLALFVAVIALALSASATAATDEPPVPRPVAPDIPTFVAPADPPTNEDPPPPPPVEPAAPLDLHTALTLALESNQDLVALSWGVRGAEAQELQGRKYANPELDIRLYRLAEQGGNRDVARARVIVTQPFELGGKRRHRVEVAGAERDIAERDLELKRAEIATAVRERFAAVLGAQRRVETLREWIAFVGGMEELVAANVARGTLRSLEVERVRRRAAQEQSNLREAEATLAATRMRLSALWGNVAPRFTEAVGTLEPTSPLPDLATVLDLAAQGPAQARGEAEQERAAAAIELAKANRTIDFAVGVGARWVEYTNEPDWLLDFAIELPFYDRGQGNVRGAKFDQARVEASTFAQSAERETLIAEAYHALTAIDARRAALADTVVPASNALVDVYQQAFDAGAATYEELLDVRRDRVDAESDNIDTLVEFHETLATLERLVGLGLPGFD